MITSAGGRPRRRPTDGALVLAGAMVTGASSTLMRLAGTSAATAALYRCLYALPVLGAVAAWEIRRSGRLPGRQLLLGAAAGVFLAADLILWFDAIGGIGAGLATVLQDSQILFVAAGAWAIDRRRPSARMWALMPVVLTGVWLVSGAGATGAAGPAPVRGTLTALASAVAYAAFLLLIGTGADGRRHHQSTFLSTVTLSAGATAFVEGALTGSLQLHPSWPSAGWLVLLGLSTQVLGWLLISAALTTTSSSQASVALLMQPAVAVAAAWLFLSERPGPLQLVGVAVVAGGTALAVLDRPTVTAVEGG